MCPESRRERGCWEMRSSTGILSRVQQFRLGLLSTISPLRMPPFSFEDCTHGNAIIYSPDDGNLILSMRNQDLGHQNQLQQWVG